MALHTQKRRQREERRVGETELTGKYMLPMPLHLWTGVHPMLAAPH